VSWTSDHLNWLVDTGSRLTTADGKTVEVWELRHTNDSAVLSAWAKHFRNHYCIDSSIDLLRGSQSRKDYLNNIKFPSKNSTLGPAVRAGDFGEILVADYLQWILKFNVPRIRWGSKVVRDESVKGSDVVGFRFHKKDGVSGKDVLAIFEAKTKFSKAGDNRLQDAINDSAKDPIRIDETLNYLKQRLLEQGKSGDAKLIERFQSPLDLPYQEIYGAAALFTEDQFDPAVVSAADTNKIQRKKKSSVHVVPHPKRDNLFLLIIKGVDMMRLINELYQRAADEA
jgi:hypothetical protein